MKNFIVCLLLAFNLSTIAQAGEVYLEAAGGIARATKDKVTDTVGTDTVSLSIKDDDIHGRQAIGYDMGNSRVALEYAYRKIKHTIEFTSPGLDLSSTDDADIHTGMLMAYYDINTGTIITPYLGAGVGASVVNSETYLASSIAAGVDVAVHKNISLVTDVRYVAVASELKSNAAVFDTKQPLDYYVATAGVRLKF